MRASKNITAFTTFVLGSLFLFGCSNNSNDTHTVSQAQAIREYEVLTLKPTDIVLNNYFHASIRGKQDIDIFPKVSGTLIQVNIDEGEKVREGQNLFIIDPTPYRIALSTAEANVESAKAQCATAQLQYESKKELYNKKIISKYDLSMSENSLLAAKASLSQAEAQLLNAKNELASTTVKSPTNGVVGMLPYRKGSLVNPGMGKPLTTVSDNSYMYVHFSMNENQMLNLMREYGSAEEAIKSLPLVTLQLGDGTTYSEKGKIESISGIIDQETGTISLIALFPNKSGFLRSGGSGTIIVPTERKNMLVIPRSATIKVQDRIYVYKLMDGAARAIPVEVSDVPGENKYIVEKGIQENETIIIEGVGLLREGTPIKVKSQKNTEQDETENLDE